MDLGSLIKRLQKQRSALDEMIAALAEAQSSWIGPVPRVKKRRGRKSMGPEERKVVAERMKKYWAMKRQAKGLGTATD
jgi:hypothetical protein